MKEAELRLGEEKYIRQALNNLDEKRTFETIMNIITNVINKQSDLKIAEF